MISETQLVDRLTHAAAPALASEPQNLIKQRLLNRELSLVEFFRQVLAEGLNDQSPLLERLRFLTIFSSIVDEFFMVRVSGLKEEVDEAYHQPSPDGMTAEQQLTAIRKQVRPMMDECMRGIRNDILPKLEKEGIVITLYGALSDSERSVMRDYFEREVFPVLTPLAVDPAHPFPYISGLSLNLGLMVRSENGDQRFVRLKVPPVLPGLIQVGDSDARFIFLSELIAANLSSLFPGMEPDVAHTFRVTRDADIEVRDDEADDLLRALEKQLRRRRFGTPVRLQVATDMSRDMIAYLTRSLGLTAGDVYRVDGPVNLSDLSRLCDLERPDLKFRPLRPIVPKVLRTPSMFDVIKERDLLLHHPYMTYSSVARFIRTAAEDKDVLAIKICLYRTGQQSRIAEALIQAAEQGKQVTTVVELKARFDEENNIEWARRLEHAGVHVVYGLMGLKTHCKLTLVVRRENSGLTRYVHIATGNYNPLSSTTYTDLGLFTTDPDIGADATEFFNYLTGFSRQTAYRKLLVAPVNLRQKLTRLIEREIRNAQANRPARIIAKLNRLADPLIIEKLYEASAAGVSIDLVVRGVCMLRPGLPGLSENIRVRSIVGRFLEHSRIFYFANDGHEELYVGSADWMLRNLNRRVEVVCPVEDPKLQRYLKDEVLAAYLRDSVNARELLADGSYVRVLPDNDEALPFNSQTYFEGREIEM
jgi:polyphosphate kinase